MSYSSAMKKRYQLLKRVSIILIFFVLFTKMHAVEPQYAESQDIQKTETNVEDNTKSPFDLVNFIVKYSDYISGLGWILLVIFIAVSIERANKKRGIL